VILSWLEIECLDKIVSKFIRTATEASYSEESLESLDNGVDVLFKKVMEDRGKAIKKVGDNNDHPTVVSSDVMQPKGLRTRPGSKRITKRHKSFLEQQSKKKTLAPKRAPPQGRSSQVYKSMCRLFVLVLHVIFSYLYFT
jgi:hypothetical protein